MKTRPVIALSAALTMVSSLAATPVKFADFQALAAQHHASLTLAVYPVSADEVRAQTAAAIQTADAAIAGILAQEPAKRSFATTFAAVDAATAPVGDLGAKLGTVAQSSMETAVRDAANEATVKLQEWSVSLTYREDLYQLLKAVADTKPALDAEAQRLLDFTMRDYRRAGLSLPAAERAEVEKLQKELAALNTEFAVNINQARAPLDFTAEELAGVPSSFLESPGVKQPDGKYRVMANVTWHAQAIGENAARAETRRQVSVARNNLAREKNVAVLTKLVALRAEIARRLGYASWADYQIETRMAKNGATAVKFEEELAAGLQPKYAAEVETLRQLKAADAKNPDARLEAWDVSYYTNKLLKDRYAVDTEALRVYFPYQATLEGMFAIYQKIFGLKFTEVEPPYVWAPGVQLYAVQDAAGGEVLGAFYLDMFPREGKFNHFACFPQKIGGVLADGRYDLPVEALLCNFPAPSADKPSLLKQNDVVTLFHEFGHVMHGLLSRSRYVALTGFAVPQDFVEAPSQMLENWVWDKAVLDTFAADYRDPTKKIPAETIAAIEAARQATEGYGTRRQLAYALIDLALHARPATEAANVDVVKVGNDTLGRVSIAPPADTAFVAYFGHLAGYDAGYYGYMWAKVLALDMASAFKHAPGGFLDEKVGRRLRDEIYGVGHTRDVGQSVEKFLGRPSSQQAFLEYVGLQK
ncbi:MAG: Zn-dependent oligopeptidase [Opitutae bacterium]|nr:Zn-dependent oligopeptidase [Opitutae bacterium]